MNYTDKLGPMFFLYRVVKKNKTIKRKCYVQYWPYKVQR